MVTSRTPVLEDVVPAGKDGMGFALEVRQVQLLRISGKQAVDFMACRLNDLNERFNQAHSRTN
jgi:uncharacterized protein YcgI (DUF1989 family)